MELDAVVKKLAPLIKRIARSVRGQWHSMDVEELRQVGAMGLLNAPMHEYDPSKGSLENFAAKWIRGAMLMHVRKDAKSRRYEREATDAIEDAFEKTASESWACDILGIVEAYAVSESAMLRTPHEEAVMREMLAIIATFRAELSERDREFCRLRFEEGVTQEEVGLALNRSTAWACRKEQELKTKLRRRMDRGG